jgi:hypothetical protein
MIVAKRDLEAGRIVLGPKKMKQGYARIISEKDGSGRIESFDAKTECWVPAAANISFAEVWAAPLVPQLTSPQIAGKPAR